MKSTRERGISAETRAERFLRRLGYEFVARNVVCAGVEIDRIAWHEGMLCFIEVRSKWRHRHGFPEETVGIAKQRRLLRGAQAYLSWHFERWPPVRFDVVAVVGRDIKVFAGAFDASGDGS
jgi:putative endonuclease